MAAPFLSFGPLVNVPDSSQTVMDASVLMEFVVQSKKKWLTDSFTIPLYVAVASAVVFLLQIVFSSRRVRRLFRRSTNAPIAADEEPQLEPEAVFQPAGYFQDLKEHVSQNGGTKIFTYRVLRVVGCLVLLGLSIATLVLDVEENELETSGKWGDRWLKPREWLAAGLCLTFLYAFLLAIISVTARKRWSHVAIRHLNAVLVVTTGVYVYRDIAPLATFTNIPRDISEGWVLWAKIAVLLFAGIVVPLSVPREYTPVDPNDPFPIPHPEQTAPLISLFLYFWMDPVVKAAYRVPHLPYEQLPPLADYDANKTLKASSFKYLDVFTGANRRHLFFGLMRIFAWDYVAMVIIMIVQLIAEFAAPIGINRLLHYLETGGKDSLYRPWLWIVWLFVGPITTSITFDWYIFIATRCLTRCESIITQLVFEHALRIRMKAEAHSSSTSSRPASGESTPSPVDSMAHVAESSDDSEVTLHSSSPTEAEGDHSREETLQGTTSSIKSADDTTGSPSKPAKDSDSSAAEVDARAKNLVGRINNLVTTDLSNIVDSRDFMRLLVFVPLQLILCVVFLYVILGWSAFVGLAVIILMFPAPGFLAKLTQDVQAATLKRTDGRVQAVTEILNVLRMVKLFGWERKMNERISIKREEELVWIRKRQFLELLSGLINFLIPVLTMMATYATYYLLSLQTIIMKEQLSSAKVFSSMAIFDMFSGQLHRMLFTVSQTVVGKVSLDRLTDFMHNTELLDTYSEKTPATSIIPTEIPTNDVIGFCKAAFSWSNDDNGSATPSGRQFLLRIEEELIFHKNSINLVIGPTGSGKTSLLMALLGEMHYIPSGPGSWFNLPREGGVAYAAQESWVLNSTIKENILFGAEFDEQRYKKVVRQCGLERDLTLFDAGDQTEVGEKGLTLSGGQKARVTLARAIYSKADIILLDDVLAALDVHTSKWIIDKCFKGDLIKDRTVILVTHNIAMAEPIAHYIVSLKEGRIASQGSLSTALSRDRALAKEVQRDEEAMHKADEEIDADEDTTGGTDEDKKSNGKLIMAEEIQEGHISWESLKLYLSALGGNHVTLFFVVFLSAYILQQVLNTAQTWFLGYWASQYDEVRDPSEVNSLMSTLGLLLLGTFLFYIVAYVIFVFGGIRASRTINRKLIESILGTTLRWLDTTPTSRIITRCTGDIRAVDAMVPMLLFAVFELTLAMLIKFIAVVAFTPIFLFPGILVAILGAWCGQIYIKAQLSVKRELSNAKAPVLGHLNIHVASIRAYGAQNAFIRESMVRIDKYTRTGRTFYNLNRWIDIRIDALGGLFSTCLATYLVYFQDIEAFNVGFSLNMAIGVSGMILWWVRCVNQFEVQGKRLHYLERIHGYLGAEQEEKASKDREPPAYWPTSGELRVENLSARYSPDGPKVLHDLSFTVKSGERIGIVGRTGSGKSSLTGTVYYDGVPTTAVNLDTLRSKITIIPQVPELLSGTLRQNLDPFDQYDDATLNDALRAAGLFSLQNEMEEGRITLDSTIASGGGNLSVGQRQILALARALVRGSKLLILDEDYKTDSIIQSSLRHELGSDMTLITVAHRLQTIMDADKIMVLEAGDIVEFDSPKNLLTNPKGKLRSLVDESADKDILYAMAEQRKES
ncbi:hypothetical protein F5146DRAFT_1040547 [Armillaria mellea]|nr:hypothetical protein F5146DRAFT_1040547 [Armillaria mellea]